MHLTLGHTSVLLSAYHLTNSGGLGLEITRCYSKNRGGYYGWFTHLTFLIFHVIFRVAKNYRCEESS